MSYLLEFVLDREKVPSFGEYPFSLRALADFERLRFDKKVTFFVGENGSGKSTLLEAIAYHVGLNPEGGTRNTLFSTANTHSDFANILALSEATDFRRIHFSSEPKAFTIWRRTWTTVGRNSWRVVSGNDDEQTAGCGHLSF